MKPYYFIALLLLCFAANAQKVTYQKTFKQTLAKAAETNKPVLMIVNPPVLPDVKNFTSGFDAPEVVKFYNDTFVNYVVSAADSSLRAIGKQYPIDNQYPQYIFLDSKGGMVYRTWGNSSRADRYLRIGQEALDRIKLGKTLTAYDEQYKAGKTDAIFLKNYLKLREELGIKNNAKLVDEYVGYLIIKSFNDYQTVLFILKAGPVINSRAYTLSHSDTKLIDSIYKKEPLQLRVAINNTIINNSMLEAVATKNQGLAFQIANFARGTWAKDFKRGNDDYNLKLLSYYKGVKDTSNYFTQASYYYDNMMRISADSIAKLKAQNMANLQKRLNPADSTARKDSAKMLVSMRTAMVPDGNSVAATLNTAAWDFYTLGTVNPQHITKAILWSRRSILLAPDNFAYYDTLAHLLYRFDIHEDAKVNQQKAIKLALADKRVPKQEVEKLKGELVKMQKGTL